jgi:hypothetical protein
MKTKPKESNRHIFARVLGKSPCRGPASYSTSDQIGLFVETFGPPEISGRSGKAFWNFTRDDGGRFSLISRLPIGKKPNASFGRAKVQVQLIAKVGIRSFWQWTAERLSGVESLEKNPPFLGSANFVVQRLGPLAVLVLLVLALGAAAKADTITDTNTTTDGTSVTVDAGQGETFTCQDLSNSFSCVDTSAFTCYGFGNCSALGATGGVLTLADFLNDYGYGPVQFVATDQPVSTPEPGVLLLLCAGITGVGLCKRRFRPALSTR